MTGAIGSPYVLRGYQSWTSCLPDRPPAWPGVLVLLLVQPGQVSAYRWAMFVCHSAHLFDECGSAQDT